MEQKTKLTDRTRIRVSPRIVKEYFPEELWAVRKTISLICKEYNFQCTHKRYNVIFFKPLNEMKYSLFVMKYGEYIIKKQSFYWHI
jgi:hypothetical protein